MSSTKTAKAYIMLKLYIFVYNSVTLTCLVIAVNCSPDAKIYNIFGPPHKFSDTAIVKNLHILNTIYLVILFSGAINLFLVYIQIVEPTADSEAEAATEEAKNEEAMDKTEDTKEEDVKYDAETKEENSSMT